MCADHLGFRAAWPESMIQCAQQRGLLFLYGKLASASATAAAECLADLPGGSQ